MKRFVRALFIGATLGLLCPPSLPAEILISNLGQAEGGGTAFNDTATRDATDFLTGPSATSIRGATLFMRNPDSIAHTFTLKLFTDNGSGTPGSLIGSFAPFTLPASPSYYSDCSTTSTGISLVANTAYWAVLQMNQNSVKNGAWWALTQTEATDAGSVFSTISTAGAEGSLNSGASWNESGPPLNMQFSLQGVVVPEPSTFVLTVVGLLGILLVMHHQALSRSRLER
jgi:hypothetical protein